MLLLLQLSKVYRKGDTMFFKKQKQEENKIIAYKDQMRLLIFSIDNIKKSLTYLDRNTAFFQEMENKLKISRMLLNETMEEYNNYLVANNLQEKEKTAQELLLRLV